MKRRLLAVMSPSTNYVPYYEVSTARSFEEAKLMIQQAEADGRPFDDLDLPVSDEALFREFLDWMEKRGRKYAFSIFGYKNPLRFQAIANEARARVFHFNS